MRGLFGVVGLLLTLAIVGVLAKKNLSSVTTVAPPAGMASAPAGATVKQQSQLIQQQVQQSVDATMQQARPMPEDK
jgi:hypothetical protein|nr:hypothetical protein [uncultured Rhodoferax sp.]